MAEARCRVTTHEAAGTKEHVVQVAALGLEDGGDVSLVLADVAHGDEPSIVRTGILRFSIPPTSR